MHIAYSIHLFCGDTIKAINIMEPAFFFSYLNTFDDYCPNGWMILIAKIVLLNMTVRRHLFSENLRHKTRFGQPIYLLIIRHVPNGLSIVYKHSLYIHIARCTLQKYLIIKILHYTYISTCVLQHYKFNFDYGEYVINYQFTTNIDWI